MKNVTYIATTVLLLLFMCSCSRNIDLPVSGNVNEPSSAEISLEEAEKEVVKLLSLLDSETKGSSSSRYIVNGYKLENNTKNSLSENLPKLYVFNFNDNKGFAIASGDRRLPPVFCVIDTGTFIEGEEIPLGASFFLSAIEEEYNSILCANGYDLPITERDSINIDFGEGGGEFIDPTFLVYGSWYDVSSKGTKLDCQWGQGDPFNAKCFTSEGEQALVGCVAVAVGQVMYYWEKDAEYNGHTYNWDLMKPLINKSAMNNSINREYVQDLLSDLGRSENLAMDYGTDGSAAYCSNISRTFLNFGYSSGGTGQDYDESVIMDEIDCDCPVIICGKSHKFEYVFWGQLRTNYSGGHEWLIDQYILQAREVQTYDTDTGQLINTSVENRTLFHCNFGWSGRWNGYYLSGIFNTNNGEGRITRSNTDDQDGYYKYLLTIHPGIRP